MQGLPKKLFPALLGVGLFFLAEWLFSGGWPSGVSFWAFWVMIVPALALSVLLHELGHVLAGWSQGMRLLSLGLGPLQFHAGQGVRWRPMQSFDGYASMQPRADMPPTGWLVYTAGGIAANVLTAVLAVALLPLAGGLAWVLLFWLVCIGLVMALLNFAFDGGGLSDGGRIRQLLPRAPERQRTAALLTLSTLAMEGQKPAAWPAALTAHLRGEAHSSPLMEGTALGLQLYALTDGHLPDGAASAQANKWPSALTRLQTLTQLADLPPILTQLAHAELAYALAYAGRSDADRVRMAQHLAEAEDGGDLRNIAPLTLARVRGAVAWAQGRHAKAREAWQAALNAGSGEHERAEAKRLAGLLHLAADCAAP